MELNEVGRPTTPRRTQRLTRILDALTSSGSAPVSDLATRLGVSAATIRRDLALLESQALIRRSHGGATQNLEELPVRFRDAQQQQAKRRIALACAAGIPRTPQAIFLGGGTTTTEVARLLAARKGLTIVTNAINIAMELVMRPQLRVIVAGGVMRPASYELVGAWTEHFIASISISMAITGVDGISLEGGLTTHDDVEAKTNQCMIEKAERVVVVADRTKVGAVTLAKMADISAVDLLITEAGAPVEEVSRLRTAGLAVQLV
jgi:DeoR family transcriptional regulator of aga operon